MENSLEESKAVLDFGNMKATFFSNEVDLMKVASGHFCIDIMVSHTNNDTIPDEIVLHAIKVSNHLTYKDLQRLHHVCGHTSSDRILKLIERAERKEKDTKQLLDKIQNSCESCQKNKKKVPRPKFSLPRADQFNQIVTIDLKEFDRKDTKRRYITRKTIQNDDKTRTRRLHERSII